MAIRKRHSKREKPDLEVALPSINAPKRATIEVMQALFGDADGGAGGGTIELRIENGEQVWRQPSAINEYNETGLSLCAISEEIEDACRPRSEVAWTRLNRTLDAQELDEVHQLPEIKRILEKARTDCVQTGTPLDSYVSSELAHRKTWRAKPTPSHLIQQHDDYFASLIKSHPLALLKCPHAQDAWIRWSYAASFSSDTDTRKKAKSYLTSCLQKQRGRPKKSTCYDRAKLLRAYHDLTMYVNRLYGCARTIITEHTKPLFARAVIRSAPAIAKNLKEILRNFPDARRLSGHGVVLEDIAANTMGPEASTVAAQYVGKYAGLSTSTIFNLASQKTQDQSR